MKGKLKLIVPILVLLAAVGVYKFVLAAPEESKAKVKGQVYVLPKEFIVNLAGGSYAKLTVALVLAAGQSTAGATAPPEGFGTLEQEPLVREIVTDTLTGASPQALTSRQGRHGYEERIKRAIDRETDVETTAVAFTDLVVQ
ncbi:MAG TPA: flagellar basal body-associated FliL family protein [Solirubrobacterales bacterium]|nr:flagellar basal body-associated FliL family protein [Solirubrobacterales bacterium]